MGIKSRPFQIVYSLDLEKHEFFVDFTFPKLQIEGEYDVNLIMFGMPIKSIGPVHVNVSKYNFSNTLVLSLVVL